MSGYRLFLYYKPGARFRGDGGFPIKVGDDDAAIALAMRDYFERVEQARYAKITADDNTRLVWEGPRHRDESHARPPAARPAP